MDIGMTSLGNLAKLGTEVRSRRWSSYDQTGGNADSWIVPAETTLVLGEMESPGCIKHIWMTTRQDDNNLRRLVLRIYWDGEITPSVLCPLGDFFGLGHATATYFESLPLQASHLGLNSWFPMPYSEGAKITITNDSNTDSFLYFYIDYQEWDKPPQDMGQFHACWRRKLVIKRDERVGHNARGQTQRLNTTGDENYVILDAQGKGHYVGCSLHIDTNESGWWGTICSLWMVSHGHRPSTELAPKIIFAALGTIIGCSVPTARLTTATISKGIQTILASTHSTASILKTQCTLSARCVSPSNTGMPMIDRVTGPAWHIGIRPDAGSPYLRSNHLNNVFHIHLGD